MSRRVLDVERGSEPDPRLGAYHNTRHASPRHQGIETRGGTVGAPWQGRFDWVFDVPFDPVSRSGQEIYLTRLRERPTTVFCKAGKLPQFIDGVLPRLEEPVCLYVGNASFPLSGNLAAAQRLASHPLVRAFFSENKDLDIARIQAMPIGIHPADLLAAGGLRTLRQQAKWPLEEKRRDVMVPAGEVLGFAAAQQHTHQLRTFATASPVLRPEADFVGRQAFWHLLARYRFVLPGWKLDLDLPEIFEALALRTLPILFESPLTEAYHGLPVVRIRHLTEITRGNLDRWWRQLSPAFADPRFLGAGYWWRKIVRTVADPKRAYLVLGPESHGTHLVTDLLVAAGCHGHSGDRDPWDSESRDSRSDRQPWDNALPTVEDPIVWRRSVPHLRHWPDLRRMIEDLEARGYGVRAIVVSRDRLAGQRSQVHRRHVAREDLARANIDRAYRHIFAHLDAADIPTTLVSYESLVHYPQASNHLLGELGLAAPATPFETWNGNEKWHREAPSGARPSEPAADDSFPEHWFLCAPENWLNGERLAARGRCRMAAARVVFCGLARNVATALPQIRARIERAAALFSDHRVIVVENDSEDDTVGLLNAWARDDPSVTVLSDELGWPKWDQDQSSERMAAMATARNTYLDRVRSSYADFDHAIVLDLDLPRGFSYEGLAVTFGTDGWDMVGSNGILVPPEGGPMFPAMFFDTWAFRSGLGDPPRPSEELNELTFRRGQEFVPVASCFGGLAVYTMAAFSSGARYSGPDCEHVAFHRELAERGFRWQYLSPSQIVLYAGDPA